MRTSGKPKYGQVTVCFAESEADAKKTALEWWPTAASKGDLSQELALPRHFEDAAEMVSEDEQIDEYADAGFDHVYLHQVGADQDGFLRFAQKELLPHYAIARRLAPRRV